MILLGRVHEGLIVDVQATNKKLVPTLRKRYGRA